MFTFSKRKEFFGFKNVVGFGISKKIVGGKKTDQECVTFFVREKIPKNRLSAKDILPEKIDSVPTDVVKSGVFKALLRSESFGGQALSRTDRMRPCPGGFSIGHYMITAGTLGMVVKDAKTGQRLILSNNHVLANSNEGKIGDSILQPGPYDGGADPQDLIAYLDRFVPIGFGGEEGGEPDCKIASVFAAFWNKILERRKSNCRVKVYALQEPNVVDAAVAMPVYDADISDEIYGLGKPSGWVAPSLGMALVKSGRTTEITTGEIEALEVTVQVDYGGPIATFEHQIVAGAMCEGGDSGSAVLTPGLKVVGLLFAGSGDRNEGMTVINPIESVLQLLEIEI